MATDEQSPVEPVHTVLSAPTSNSQDLAPIRTNKPFRRYFAGFAASLLGDQIWFVALGWAASLLGDPMQTTLVMATATLPRAVLLLFGGILADRRGVLRTTLASQTGRMTIMLAGALALFLTSDTNLAVLLTLSLLFGIFDAVHLPAAAALPVYILPRQDLPAGQGAVLTLERTATILGAPLGGYLVAAGGLSTTTLVIALLLAVALITLRTLRTQIPADAVDPEEPSTSAVRDLFHGLRYAATHPVLGRILLAVTVLNLALAGPLNVGIALLAAERGWSAGAFSLIVTGFAIGAAAGAISVTARRQRPAHPAAAGLYWAFLGSAGVAALPVSSHLPVAIAAASFLGITTGPAGAYLLGTVQAQTSKQYMGRIMALSNFSALGLMPLSIGSFGVLAKALGVNGAFYACALGLAVSAALAYASGAIRTASLTDPASTADTLK